MRNIEKPKFTPGPWKREFIGYNNTNVGYYEIRDSDGCYIATGGDVEDMFDPDSALIAAAPEMYEVLTRIKREMECDENWYMITNGVEDVLKKARGEK